jgi:hypothetical protein
VLPRLKGVKHVTLVHAFGSGITSVGSASNPPVTATKQSLVVSLAAGAAAQRARARVLTLAQGTTRIPTGLTRSLLVRLTAAGQRLLRQRHTLRCTLVILVSATGGRHATLRTTITLELARTLHRR